MQVSGKTILITGGTDGIGLRLAQQLRDKGANVIITGRTPERIAAAEAAGFTIVPGDLALASGIDATVAAAKAANIDILINNAGMGSDYEIDDAATLTDADRCIALNLNAPIHLTTQLLPLLRARPQAMIVNVTSGLAIAPRAGGSIYCATKAGLRSYTLALRHLLKGSAVHILEALPPVVDTRLTAGRGSNKMSPEECAKQIISAIERNAKEANVGMVKILRLVYSISPALARAIMIKF
jgi:uncharacterized oxidoreductase